MNRRFAVWYFVAMGVLGAGLILLLMPGAGFAAGPRLEPPRAAAPAATITYTVNVTSDAILFAGCVGGIGSCSLRGAVQLANAVPGTALILFAPSVNGLTITLGSTLVFTGSNIALSDPGLTRTLIVAPHNAPAFNLLSDSNELDYLVIAGGGVAGGVSQDGVFISGTNNLVFGSSLYRLGGQGVRIAGTGIQNKVTSSFIGVQVVGGVVQASCANANNTNGIVLDAPNSNIVGNTIGCNSSDGLVVENTFATGNYVYGNYIGVTAAGQPIPNGLRGIRISDGAANNVIGAGGSPPNVIANNPLDGVYIAGNGTSGNRVVNNLIGVGPAGNTAAGNGANGVQIDAAADSNTIGGRVLTEANTIAGNVLSGILLNGIGANNATDTRYNLIIGNRIGLNAAGAQPVPNGGSGILLSNGAWGNTVGDPSAEFRNTIAGNAGDGVAIAGARSNTVMGNLIGLNISVTAEISNAQNGLRLDGGAEFNSIHDNQIYASGALGVIISGSATTTNTLLANAVFDGLSSGMLLQNGARGNLISGSFVKNNAGNGIVLDGAATGGNLITDTLSAFNGLAGIRERNGASANVWSRVSIYDNGGLGIDLDPALAPTGPYPTILTVTVTGGSVSVSGKVTPPFLQSIQVELYRVALDPSGFGEGKTYLGSASADSSGNWSVAFTGAAGCFTALQTTNYLLSNVSASSEFGPNSCRLFLPLVRR